MLPSWQSDTNDSKNKGAAMMASGDANVPPISADQNNSVRRCEKCDAEMKQLAELPALSIRAAIKVFRCYGCDHVVSDRA
ncbi:MAG: hypothetical protein JWR80_3911 [Bradyrhizobium sp.]|nr:hypothetical protein [Bradyrhizobium sp.]